MKTEENDVIAEQINKTLTPPHPTYRPKMGDYYFQISAQGTVGIFLWENDKFDNKILKFRNVFHTEEEARFTIERLKVLAEMRTWAGRWDDPFYIIYFPDDGKILIGFSEQVNGDMHFATKEDALNCIMMVGVERIKKYYFCIPEGY